MYIPEGYGTVFPYVFVNEATKFIKFLQDAFGAEEVGRTAGPDGSVANSRVRIGTSTFMVSEASERFEPRPSSYYLFVEDADVTCAKALSCGADKIFDPMDMPYGDRQGGIVDPFGNIWWVSTRTSHEPYDKQ